MSDFESDAADEFGDISMWTCVDATEDHQKVTIWHFYPYDPDDVPAREQADKLRDGLLDLLEAVKVNFGSSEPISQGEMKQFIKSVYRDGFRSDEPHSIPDDNETRGGLLTTGILIGELRKDLPLSKKAKAKAGLPSCNGTAASKNRAKRAESMMGNSGLQLDKYRRAAGPHLHACGVPQEQCAPEIRLLRPPRSLRYRRQSVYSMEYEAKGQVLQVRNQAVGIVPEQENSRL